MYYDNHLRIFGKAGDFMHAKRKHKREKIRQAGKKKSRILKRKPSALKKASLKKMIMALMKQEDKKRKLSQKKRDKRTALLIKQNALLVKQNRELRKRITRRPAIAPARRPAYRIARMSKHKLEKKKRYTTSGRLEIQQKERQIRHFASGKTHAKGYATIVVTTHSNSPLTNALAYYVAEIISTKKNPITVSQAFLEKQALRKFVEEFGEHMQAEFDPSKHGLPKVISFRWDTVIDNKARANIEGWERAWRTKVIQIRKRPSD